jgi:hypothetical protein
MFVFDRTKQAFTFALGGCLAWFAPDFAGQAGGWVTAIEERDAGQRSSPFWQKKGVQEWSIEEVRLFLQDSPWAKTERISISVKSVLDATELQTAPVAGAVRMMKFESCCRTFEVPMAGSNADSATASTGGKPLDFSKESSRTWSFSATVQWFSAVSIRRAIIRQRQLQGIPMEQPEAALAPSSDFVLALSGSFLKLLEGLPSEEVKAISFIQTAGRTKKKLSPVEFIPSKPDADPMAFLIFPKTLEGKPALSAEDRSVTFYVKGIDFELECRFPLELMVVDGKLDW